MTRLPRSISPWRVGFGLTAVLLVVWGARLTWIEGIVQARAQGFAGDFYYLMFGGLLWDGTGMVYGPLFVVERWLMAAFPRIFTIETFWLIDLLLVPLSFVCAVAAARPSRLTGLLALGMWLASRHLFYALSTVANPEFIELALLSASWLAISLSRVIWGYLGVALAALTKFIPAIFGLMLVIVRPSRRGLAVAVISGVILSLAVGLGQRMSPLEALTSVFFPFLYHPAAAVAPADLLRPWPSYTEQVLGLSSAIARALALGDNDERLPAIQLVTEAVVAGVILACAAVLAVLSRSKVDERTKASLSYGLFFALLPVATLNTHPHTFVMLLPAWIASVSVLERDLNVARRVVGGSFVAVAYALISIPAAVQIPARTLIPAAVVAIPEPIWIDLLLIAGLAVYALWRGFEASPGSQLVRLAHAGGVS